MAQHDYVIANGTGAAVRSDLNNALAAIVSNNSGATEPATMYAYQWWADTSTGLLKLRNAANNAWITLRELDGTLTIEAGTVSAPGLAFASDLNTGIYSPGADQVAITTNGVERVEWGTTEVVFNDGGTNYDFRIEGDTVDSLFFVDASTDRVGLGTSSPSALFHVAQDSSDGTQARITGATNQNYQLRWGFDTTNLVGRIQSIHVGTAYRALALNPDGGNVGIGSTAPNRVLDVNAASGNGIALTPTAGNATNWIDWFDTGGGPYGRIGYDHQASAMLFHTNNSEKARLDLNGRFLVGTSSARSNFFNTTTSTPLFQVEGASSGVGQLSSFTYGESSNGGPYLVLGKHRGTTTGGVTLVNDGDQIGAVSFQGSDGSEFVEGARIQAFVDGTPGANDLPSRLVFSTTADGASSPTERFRLSANGSVRVPGFYDFATASAANVNIDSDYIVRRSTSSVKYKKDVETIAQNYSDALLGCRPVWYRSKCDSDNPDWGWWGFIAEEVAAIDPRLVHWRTTEPIIKEDGSTVDVPLATPEPEGVQYDRFVPHLLNLIKRQKEQIEAMEARLSALEGA